MRCGRVLMRLTRSPKPKRFRESQNLLSCWRHSWQCVGLERSLKKTRCNLCTAICTILALVGSSGRRGWTWYPRTQLSSTLKHFIGKDAFLLLKKELFGREDRTTAHQQSYHFTRDIYRVFITKELVRELLFEKLETLAADGRRICHRIVRRTSKQCVIGCVRMTGGQSIGEQCYSDKVGVRAGVKSSYFMPYLCQSDHKIVKTTNLYFFLQFKNP